MPPTSVGRCLEWLERGATAVTATRRLARHLTEQYAQRQRAKGAEVWDSPDVRIWDVWLDHVLRESGGEQPPVVLNDAQELALWEQVIRDDLEVRGSDAPLSWPLWQHSPAARAARHAHVAFHNWCMQDMSRDLIGNDAEAFLRWQLRFTQHCREHRYLDGAMVATSLLARLESLRECPPEMPETLIVAGFSAHTPLQEKLLTALAALGVRIVTMAMPAVGDRVWRCRAEDPDDELLRAASWCRRKLLEGGGADGNAGLPKLGIVIGNLEQYRDRAARIFEQVLGGFDPSLDSMGASRLFHLSLGMPLARYPVVAAALEWLEWLSGDAAYETFSRSVRSPFITGAATEWAARGRLDLELRKVVSARVTPAMLRSALKLKRVRNALPPVLGAMLHKLLAVSTAADKPQSPAEWSVTFSQWLTIAGWPGERALDSHEYQTLAAWNDMLVQFASLGLLERNGHVRQAWMRVMQIASIRVFNPKAVPAPVQLLGVDEAVGLEFDALWVTGLGNDDWPPSLRPLPFLPVAEQRRLRMPEALWDVSFSHARDTIEQLKVAAPEVMFSYPENNGERTVDVSPLIRNVREEESTGALFRCPESLGSMTDGLDRMNDGHGPKLVDGHTRVHGGAGLFGDQAACPFLGFARHRLGSETIQPARVALNAMDHGSMVHMLLEYLWEPWQTQDDLKAARTETDVLERRLGSLITDVLERYQKDHPGVMSRAARELQHRRLLELLLANLEFEVARPSFTVVEREKKLERDFHGVPVRVRVDRVDRVEGGHYILIDYKTGQATPGSWFDKHLKAPQLPLYRALLDDQVAGVMFARVRCDTTEADYLAGLCDEGIVPFGGLKPVSAFKSAQRKENAIHDWPGLVAHWDVVLKDLALSIANGDAKVNPQPQACRYCDQRMLCRIDERKALNGDDEDETDESGRHDE